MEDYTVGTRNGSRMGKDFQLFHSKDNKWVEEDNSFDFILGSNTELIFKLLAKGDLKNIGIKLNTKIKRSGKWTKIGAPLDLAIVDNLDSVRIFTSEDVYHISSLANRQVKFLVLRFKPEGTGDYEVSFIFDYLVK